jgi:hypothetical protein
LLTAYNNAFAQTPDTGFVAGVNQLGGQPLTAAVYRFPAATTPNLIETLTLDGEGDPNAVWVFQANFSLVTAAGSQALLTGAAQACNVFKNGALPAPFFYLDAAVSAHRTIPRAISAEAGELSIDMRQARREVASTAFALLAVPPI